MSALSDTPVTHAALVVAAVRWLRATQRCTVVFAEMTAGAAGYSPDALGWHRRFSILVECKVSRADFFADRKKMIHVLPDNFPGEERWYLTLPGLVQPHELPEGWWLAEATRGGVRMVTHPPPWPNTSPRDARCPSCWRRVRNNPRMAAGVPYLLSAVRRHQIGARWLDAAARFESVDQAKARIGVEGRDA